MLYTTKELATIITSSTNNVEVTEAMEYIFENAVAIIRDKGASYYNTLVFSIKEKFREVTPIIV